MKAQKIAYLAIFTLLSIVAFADTPPPGAVKIKDASGNLITSTNNGGKQSLDVNITSTSGASTSNQGTPNTTTNAWPVLLCNSGGAHCLSINSDGSLNADVSGSVSISNFPSSQNVVITNSPTVTVSNPDTNYSLETGGHLASIDSKLTNPLPISASSLPLPSGAATNSELVTINTTLGSPFQSGGSIGNTVFGATQSGAWSTGRTWALNSGTDSVAISGTVTSSNSANGNPGSAPPSQATQVAGSDGTDLRVMKVSSTGVLSVDGSAVTQPVSGSVSVSNFPATQPISGTVAATQSGTWTVQQGGSPWSVSQSGTWNLNNISGTISLPTGAATNAELVTINSTLGSPFQAGGSIGNTVFGATQSGSWSTGRTWSLLHSTDSVASWSLDGAGNALTSQVNGSARALDVGIDVAGTQVDPRSIRALTSADTVTVVQPTGSNLHVAVDSAPTTTVTGTIAATQSGTWNVNNVSGTVSLPTGAATSANQTTANTSLATIATNTTGLATSANQTNGNQEVQGNVAAGTADSGNGVKVSGIYNSTLPTYTTGQRGDLQVSSKGSVLVAGGAPVGSAPADNPVTVAGVDNNGNKQYLSTDTSGHVNVNPVSATPDFTATGSLTAACSTPTSCGAGSTVTLNATSALGNMVLELQGTFVGTVIVEGSNDSGSNWNARSIIQTAPAQLSSTGVSAPGYYRVSGVGGYGLIRARMTAFTSGSATTNLRASVGTDVTGVINTNANNLVASIGVAGAINTYSACYVGLTTQAAPTDIFTVTGSATKVVTINKVQISGTQGTVAMRLFNFITRSSADSGGTCVAATTGPLDQSDPAATASAAGCNPSPTTLGTLFAYVGTSEFVIPATTGVDSTWPQVTKWGEPGSGQGVVLRGTSQQFVINMPASATTSSLNICVYWTEQ